MSTSPTLIERILLISVVILVLMFGNVSRLQFGTAHLMWFYVLIFALLTGANFADRYSVDRLSL